MHNKAEFERRLPKFALQFVDKLHTSFEADSIHYTKIPDMRIRKRINRGKGFINAVTLEWRSRQEVFLMRTVLSEMELSEFKLNLTGIGYMTLTSETLISEADIETKADLIIDAMRYAQYQRYHATHE